MFRYLFFLGLFFALTSGAKTEIEKALTDQACKKNPAKCLEILQKSEEEQRKWEDVKDASERERQDKKGIQQELLDRRTDRQQICMDASREIQDSLKEDKDKKKQQKEKFYDVEEEISELEQKLTEQKNEMLEKREDLKKDYDEKIADFRKESDEKSKEIDEQIDEIKDQVSKFSDKLHEIEEQMITVHFEGFKKQREFFDTCYTQALKFAREKRQQYKRKVKTGRAKQRNFGALMIAGKRNVTDKFKRIFNQQIAQCIGNSVALSHKEMIEKTTKMLKEKLERQKKRLKEKIVIAEEKIKQLMTSEKVKALTELSRKLKESLGNFNQSYESLVSRFQETGKSIQAKIEKKRKKQSSFLRDRVQNVSDNVVIQSLKNDCREAKHFLSLFAEKMADITENEDEFSDFYDDDSTQ